MSALQERGEGREGKVRKQRKGKDKNGIGQKERMLVRKERSAEETEGMEGWE